jgi:hypothetical protein
MPSVISRSNNREYVRRQFEIAKRQIEIDALAVQVLREPDKEQRATLLERLRALLKDSRGSIIVEDVLLYGGFLLVLAYSFHTVESHHWLHRFIGAMLHTVAHNSCGQCPIGSTSGL